MWMNLKPFSDQLHNRKAIPYKIGITGPYDVIDQHRNLIDVRPGEHAVIKVIPRLIKTSADFDGLRMDQRKCKLSHEIDEISLMRRYTRIGCETDCAIKKAMPICKCIPWHYPNDYHTWPICEMFGAHCFDLMMSADTNYNGCKYRCQKDCKEIDYIVLPQYFPLDFKKECSGKSFHNQHFRKAFRKHFSFLNYKALIDGEFIDTVGNSFSNGSMCEDYIRDFVALVSVEGPTSAVILTERDNRIFLIDQIAAIGGNFGLFTGTSMLSIAEFVILLLSLVYAIVYHFYQMCVDPLELKKDLDVLRNKGNSQQIYNTKLQSLEDGIEALKRRNKGLLSLLKQLNRHSKNKKMQQKLVAASIRQFKQQTVKLKTGKNVVKNEPLTNHEAYRRYLHFQIIALFMYFS